MGEIAKIISYANQKGGVGKSTLTTLTCNALSQAPYNKNILVIDSDIQGGIMSSRKMDKMEKGEDFKFPYNVIHCTPVELPDKLDEFCENYERRKYRNR